MILENVTYGVPLNEERIKKTNEEVIDGLNWIADLTAELKEYTRQKREEIKKHRMAVDFALNCLREGRMEEVLDLRVEFNQPEEGKKSIYDACTGELYEVVDMTDEDRQDLFAQAEPSAKDAQLTPICANCGAVRKGVKVYHVDRNKAMCVECLVKKNRKNFARIKKALQDKVRVIVRPTFGYGCTQDFMDTTCFRFIICEDRPDGHCPSWGTPVYMPGDYHDETTEAWYYYKGLIEDGAEIEKVLLKVRG